MQLFVNGTQSVALKSPLPVMEADVDFHIKKIFPLLQTPLFNKLIGNALPAAYSIFEKLNALISRHAHYEYTSASGAGCLLGNTYVEMKGTEGNRKKLDRYPLPHLWREFYQREITSFPAMLQLLFALSTHWGEGHNYKVYEFMNKEFIPEIRKFYGFDLHGLKTALGKLPHFGVVNSIMPLLGEENWDAAYADSVAENILASFLPFLDKGSARKEFIHEAYMKKERRTVFLHQHSSINYWMSDAFGRKQPERAFTEYFMLRYRYYSKSDCLTTRPPAALPKGPLSVFDFGHAYALGLIPESEILQELQTRVNAEESLNLASSFLFGTLKPWLRNRLKAYGETDFAPLKEVVKKVSDRILGIEVQRGEPATEVSHLAMKLERIEGAALWVGILKAFDKEPFGRTDYFYSSSYSRKEVLSRLLRVCYPSETDTPQTLSALAKDAGIPHERLMEAAVYAPQWLEMAENCIGWKGLRSTACFFHAHINERCDESTKALIAHFTPIDPDDLLAGAFDLGWYREASREIGAKRFEKVCEAAKYIASASEHARFSKYMDAANGKMDAKEVKTQVEEKRNRDLLMMYSLIPLNKRSNNDLIERYRYLQQFLKESKAFGSQRQESEKKAVELGMLNLARNADYHDVTRMIWSVETSLFKHIESCFAPYEKDGVKVYMKVDGTGKPGIHYFKAGKELGNIPGKLRKDPHIVRLREVNKRLKSLYARSVPMLEQAMEERIPFLISELKAFRKNPLVWPLLKHLVFITQEETTGFYTGEGLLPLNGGAPLPQEPATEVRIAHPVDLCRLQMLEPFQACLLDKGIHQPFEQVFRKRYDKTEEEKAAAYSLRRAEERIRPDDMAAILKGRRWVAAGEEKWLKVFYKEKIAVVIEAMSHAPGPADAGISTLERVAFFEQKSNRPLLIAGVPDRVFSEIMRDVDLLFSIA
ncbi:MAG: DUF4132 domain-containing protein [Tannerellaceae bacterium]|jgi:hypothetical protein|nr:DUF4132 domain-containing protein [Tannerellaceae bacterium]